MRRIAPMADPAEFKQQVIAALWRAADRLPTVQSATLAGSFATGSGLDGFSDIDTIIIVDTLDADGMAIIQETFRSELAPVLDRHGWMLRINATLGPLKFNDANTAVLHLMLYTAPGHLDHVVKSPFTCLDWQRSPLWRKAPMAAIYPVFSLQPRHFFGARRSAKDYLADLQAGMISYRELAFAGGYHEIKRGKPMDVRDRHEFAYHILRFLMQNLLKLVERSNQVVEGETLLARFTAVFPDGMGDFGPLFLALADMKKAVDFTTPIVDLLPRVAAFAHAFEAQFRQEFARPGSRQVWCRHAPTAMNRGMGAGAVLQGRTDPPVLPIDPTELGPLLAAIRNASISRIIASPLLRARQTAQAAALGIGAADGALIATDARLLEIDYSRCEGLTAAEATRLHPVLKAGWAAGNDPSFPDGECSADVRARVLAFADEAPPSCAVVTHNVALRELIGSLLRVPEADRWRLRIPHLAPVGVVKSRRYGCFVDLDEAVETQCFAGFFQPTPGADS